MSKKEPEKESNEDLKNASQDSVVDSEDKKAPVEEEKTVQDDQDFESEEVDELAALKDENASLRDQLLRKTADLENYRKRMIRERQDTVKFGNQELLKDLVEIIDNFERALNSSKDSKDYDSFYNGILMIEQQFTDMLASKYNLTKMMDTGAEYDPNCHEALMMEETDKVKTSTVLEIFQTGYMLHDRVLRPAKVKVGKPAASGAEKKSADEA